MQTIVITGGIAMGKSTVMKGLRILFPSQPEFDADASVSNLLTAERIARKIAAEFGESALNRDGSVNRPFLREQVFDSVKRRAALESILHPEVRKDFESIRQKAADSGADILMADIPLYFESEFPYPADLVLVVAADSGSQMERLTSRPGICPAMAEKMIAAQLPVSEKMDRAEAVIWNSGSRQQLETQLQYLGKWLKTKM